MRTLINQTTEWYLNAGYITSQAFLLPQNLAGGVLNVKVVEGKRQFIGVNQKTDRNLETVLPPGTDRLLNLWDIEQGMEQINRLRRQPVKIDISPGSEPESSIINLMSSEEFPLMLNLSADNSRQKSTCVSQSNGSVVANDLLGIADQWYVSGSRCSPLNHSGDSRSFQSGTGLVYGYWSWDYSYSWSDYLSPFRQQFFQWRYHGGSESHRAGLSRVL